MKEQRRRRKGAKERNETATKMKTKEQGIDSKTDDSDNKRTNERRKQSNHCNDPTQSLWESNEPNEHLLHKRIPSSSKNEHRISRGEERGDRDQSCSRLDSASFICADILHSAPNSAPNLASLSTLSFTVHVTTHANSATPRNPSQK